MPIFNCLANVSRDDDPDEQQPWRNRNRGNLFYCTLTLKQHLCNVYMRMQFILSVVSTYYHLICYLIFRCTHFWFMKKITFNWFWKTQIILWISLYKQYILQWLANMNESNYGIYSFESHSYYVTLYLSLFWLYRLCHTGMASIIIFPPTPKFFTKDDYLDFTWQILLRTEEIMHTLWP